MLPNTWLGEWKLAEVEKKTISVYGLVYKELWPARGHLESECCGCEVTGSGRGRQKEGAKEKHLGVVCLLYDWNEVVEVPTHRVSWCAFLLQVSHRLLMLVICSHYSQLFHIPCYR